MLSRIYLLKAFVILLILGLLAMLIARYADAQSTSSVPYQVNMIPIDLPLLHEESQLVSTERPDTILLAATQAATQLVDMRFSEGEADTVRQGLLASLSLFSTGDSESYLEYRTEFSGRFTERAEAIADQQFYASGHPDYNEQQWTELSAEEKFEAIISQPSRRNADLLEINPRPYRIGIGEVPRIPKGYRIQGMKSAIDPPSSHLFLRGSDARWAWIDYEVRLPAIPRAVLRLEFVYEDSVGAWLMQRAALIGPSEIKLPWLVF